MAIGIKRPPIFKIFCTQLVVTLLISSVYYLVNGRVAAYSAVLGGLIFVIPQLYFGIKAFMFSGARAIDKIVINFYKGESSKIIIIVIGFTLVFSFTFPVDYFALYSSFIAILVVNCFSAYIE
ncbi:MAG: ATP synthase protein I [Oleiphilaceae bacterium]|jgi:ATP synthase protein I